MLSVSTERIPQRKGYHGNNGTRFWTFYANSGRCDLKTKRGRSKNEKRSNEGAVSGNRQCGKYWEHTFHAHLLSQTKLNMVTSIGQNATEANSKNICPGVIWGKREKKRMDRINQILKENDCNRRPQVHCTVYISHCLTCNWVELNFIKVAICIVSCPTRWSKHSYILDFCDDHLSDNRGTAISACSTICHHNHCTLLSMFSKVRYR